MLVLVVHGLAIACSKPARVASGPALVDSYASTTGAEPCLDSDIVVAGQFQEIAFMDPVCHISDRAQDACHALGLEGYDFCLGVPFADYIEEGVCPRPGDHVETIPQVLRGLPEAVSAYTDVGRTSVLTVEARFEQAGYCCDDRRVNRIAFGPSTFRGCADRVALLSPDETPLLCGSSKPLDEVCETWAFWTGDGCPDFDAFLDASGWGTTSGPGAYPENVEALQCDGEAGGWGPYFNVVTWYDGAQWTAAFTLPGVMTFVERIDPVAGQETTCSEDTFAIGEAWGAWALMDCHGAPRWVRGPSGEAVGPEPWELPYGTYAY